MRCCREDSLMLASSRGRCGQRSRGEGALQLRESTEMATSLPPYIREAVREAAKTCVRAETSPPVWDATVSTRKTSISLPGPV